MQLFGEVHLELVDDFVKLFSDVLHFIFELALSDQLLFRLVNSDVCLGRLGSKGTLEFATVPLMRSLLNDPRDLPNRLQELAGDER